MPFLVLHFRRHKIALYHYWWFYPLSFAYETASFLNCKVIFFALVISSLEGNNLRWSILYLIILLPINFCLKYLLLWHLKNGDFSLYYSFYIYYLEFYCKEDLSIFSLSLCNMDLWIHILKVIHYCLYFVAQIVTDLAIRNPFKLVPLSFWHVPIIFWALLYFVAL